MTNNPYPIQIKKRVCLNLINGISMIFVFSLLFIFMSFIGIEMDKLSDNPLYNHNGFLPIIIFIIIIVLLIIGIPLIISIIWDFLYLNSIEYSLDNKNLTFKGGIISRFEKVIPYSKIQHAIIYESFWQRVLGLSSVSIETARESGYTQNGYNQQKTIQTRIGPFIPDLNKEDAEKLKNYIISVSNNKYKSVAGI